MPFAAQSLDDPVPYSFPPITTKSVPLFLYSTTAAYLANRLKGDSEFLSEFPADILSFSKMIELQEILSNLGYEVGKIDGILGAKTRQSVRKVQIELGFPADSWPTIELLDALK